MDWTDEGKELRGMADEIKKLEVESRAAETGLTEIEEKLIAKKGLSPVWVDYIRKHNLTGTSGSDTKRRVAHLIELPDKAKSRAAVPPRAWAEGNKILGIPDDDTIPPRETVMSPREWRLRAEWIESNSWTDFDVQDYLNYVLQCVSIRAEAAEKRVAELEGKLKGRN